MQTATAMRPVVVLDDRVLGRHARPAVSALDGDDWVVVVRRGLDLTHVAVRANAIRDVDDDVALVDGLDLTMVPSVTSWDPGGDEAEPDGPTVVMGPDGVVGALRLDELLDLPLPGGGDRGLEDGAPGGGWLDRFRRPVGDEGERTTRSWRPPSAARPDSPASAGPDLPRSADPPAGDEPLVGDGPPPSAGDGDEQAAGADPDAGTDDGDTPATADLTTHARLEAAEQVTSGAAFDLGIGLGDEPMPGAASSEPMRLLEVGESTDIEVQVIAPGCTMPQGGRRFLHVRRDDPTGATVTVPLVAPEVTEPRRLDVQVQYVHRGMPIGKAWREVVVTPTDDRVDTTVDTGSAPVTVSDPRNWADLTVLVSDGDRPDVLTWSFFTNHDVAIAEQAERSLDAADARDFAHQQVVRLGQSAGSELEVTELTGVSRIVADVMPPEFWDALAAVAAVVDGPPSLFLVTADPWVPWELASTETTYLPPEVVDPDTPMFLGAQFRVARWLEQRRVGRETAPVHPPADHHAISCLCLVIGDYLAENGQRPLPAAIAEGQELSQRYPNVWRSATATDLDEVLGDRIRERGTPRQVDALHMACHGRFSDDARATGIVLSDDRRTLSPTTVRGSTLTQTRHPFVFLNACQVGQAMPDPGGYGGMAGAFVREGAIGFVAPLWEVGDDLANRAALEFYHDTLEADLPVAEAMRRFRSEFTKGESTRLAYVYYGHPGLRLSLADASGDQPDPARPDGPAG